MSLATLALVGLLTLAGAAAPERAAVDHGAAVASSASPEEEYLASLPHSNSDLQTWGATYRYEFDIKQSLLKSASPRDWALATLINSMEPSLWQPDPLRARVMRHAAESAPDDPVVQWIWLANWPDATGCDAPHPCPQRAAALARIEPDNAAALMPLVNEAWIAHDVPGVDAALLRSAAATRFDDPYIDARLAWLKVFREHPPRERGVNATVLDDIVDAEVATGTSVDSAAFPEAFSEVESDFPLKALVNQLASAALTPCDATDHFQAAPGRAPSCVKLGRIMLMHSNCEWARFLGRELLRMSGLATDDDRREALAYAWQDEKAGELLNRFTKDPALRRAFVEDVERTHSDVDALQRMLGRARISLTPPTGWQPTLHGKHIGPLGESLQGQGK